MEYLHSLRTSRPGCSLPQSASSSPIGYLLPIPITCSTHLIGDLTNNRNECLHRVTKPKHSNFWGRCGWTRPPGQLSLALGERSGVSPGPGPSPSPSPIHKSAAAASGPRGICSSARDAPLSWRRPRNEPRSALVAGMRNRGGGGGQAGG